jgi:L-lactate dehydrogenase complex protein LldG
MNSREKILASVKESQPEFSALPEIKSRDADSVILIEQYCSVLQGIGGSVHIVNSEDEMLTALSKRFGGNARKISVGIKLNNFTSDFNLNEDPHSLEDTELAIIRGHFGVAENGSIWVTEEQMGLRALPFICQHLAVVFFAEDIVANMHEAYDRIGNSTHSFGTFIAGPSKTADIEQSLVLGAHGPMSMSVFLLRQ